MLDEKAILRELSFKFIRSSGAGGQHVNKTSSKVELTFDLENSQFLSIDQKQLIKTNLRTRLTKEDVLILQCGESRSQHKNKDIIIKRFLDLISEGLIEEKDRILTKIPRAVVRKRLTNKRKTSEKKSKRKPPEID
ncbi:MAG: ribosome-associated protein [Psychroserpens sp.]|jgi:ribosome-associated protein|uniref:alternative ribosome rescue aminoacyl-tRNA hydrolase ArfB n=1 Tax=Psychroserpens sp. TaxID=2020870 RepID=UPI0039E627A0